MKQRWGVKKRFEEVKTRVLTGGRTLRELLVVIQSGLRSPGVLVTAAHVIVVAPENIHEVSWEASFFLLFPFLVNGVTEFLRHLG